MEDEKGEDAPIVPPGPRGQGGRAPGRPPVTAERARRMARAEFARRLEVLLPETSIEKAERVAQTLVTDEGGTGADLLVGLATYPQHGGTADGLIAAAQEAFAKNDFVGNFVLIPPEETPG